MRALLVPLLALLLPVQACESRTSTSDPIDRVRKAVHEGETVLDARQDGAVLVVRPLAGKPQSDGPRRLAVRKVVGNKSIDLGTEEHPIADAKLVEGGVVVLGLDGVLSRVGDDGATRTIDRSAWGPLSVRAGKVAYVRGEPPSLEVAVAEIERGAPVALAPGWWPAWCPAIAEDGSVVFVSGQFGGGELARAKVGEAPRTIASGPNLVLPEGPEAPIVIGNDLLFEQGDALRVVGLDGVLKKTIPGAHAPVAMRAGNQDLVIVRGDDALRALPVAEVIAR